MVGLTDQECQSGIGRIDIDGSDTVYTKFLIDCDSDEYHAIMENESQFVYLDQECREQVEWIIEQEKG